MLNTLVLGQALIGTKVHGWGDPRRASEAKPATTGAKPATTGAKAR